MGGGNSSGGASGKLPEHLRRRAEEARMKAAPKPFCNDPAHSEPYACSREAEGGWVCEAQLELEREHELSTALTLANDELRKEVEKLKDALKKEQARSISWDGSIAHGSDW